MRKFLQRLRPTPPEVDAAIWSQVRRAVPWISALDAPRDERLRALTAQFLRLKTFTPLAGLSVDDVQRATVAGLCCLPLLEFGAEGMRGWSQLLVYPEAFRVNRTHIDAAGVMHEWDDELIGEAWEAGPVILSWADLQADLAEPDAGFCVAAHEIAHKLDALDGALDGTPPLPREWQRRWARDFQVAYDALCAEADSGRQTAIDEYAAEAPEEFFAVASEYHFSAPDVLRETMPEVAQHLARFYGPSPFATSPAF